MIIGIGSDHAGFEIKEYVKKILKELGIRFVDYGTDSNTSVDYPDYGEKAAVDVVKGKVDLGILVCGTGIGISIAANKVKGARAALCCDAFMAEMSKRHNNANILVLRGINNTEENVKCIVEVWLKTPFDGGRHQKRIDKIHEIERKNNV
jgi:ribose 5-phosphate isomerase B